MKIIIKICVKIDRMPGTLTASSTTGFIFLMWTASLPACWSVTSSSSSSTINHHLNLKGLQERLGRPAWVFWERKPPGIKKSLIQNYPHLLPILGRSGPRGPCLCHICQWVQHRWGRNIKSSWRIEFYKSQPLCNFHFAGKFDEARKHAHASLAILTRHLPKVSQLINRHLIILPSSSSWS